jgi:pantothenate kinase
MPSLNFLIISFSIQGTPVTFDVARFTHDLKRVKVSTRENVLLPAYDRCFYLSSAVSTALSGTNCTSCFILALLHISYFTFRALHDPVDDALCVSSEATVVIVEGLFLLQLSDGWEGVSPLFDLTLFLDMSRPHARANALARKLRTSSLSGTMRHQNDDALSFISPDLV